MSEKSFSRRSVAIGGGIAAALGLTALGLTMPRLFAKHYPATPYDDLLGQLADRDAAKRVGDAIDADIDQHSPIDGAPLTRDMNMVARELRKRLRHSTLREVTQNDLAEGRLAEAKGWVLPETLAALCVLASKS